jgi:hypothetical protein
MKWRLVAVVFFSAGIGSCATSYQPSGFTGGFSETPLAGNAYRILAEGNGYSSANRMNDMALVRAAELTLQNNYYSFVVTDQKGWEKRETLQVGGGQYSSTTTVVGSGNFATAQTYGSYTPPQYMDVSKPRTAIIVVMYRQGEAGADTGLNPRQIIQTYGPRVGYKGPYLVQSSAP